MTEPQKDKGKRSAKRRQRHRLPKHGRTFWHTLAGPLLAHALPSGYVLEGEVAVSRQPQRADFLIVRTEEAHHESLGILVALFDRLNHTTVLELKGATDGLEAGDVSNLVGYGFQLTAKERLTLGTVTLGVLAPRLTQSFRERLSQHGGSLECVRPGEWEGSVGGYPFFVLELEIVCEADARNRYFVWLTARALEDFQTLEPRTRAEEMLFYDLTSVLSDPSRWRESQMNTMRSFEARMKAARKRTLEAFYEELSPEERMRGIPPEERLKGLKAEERLRALKAEEGLQGLKAEDLVRNLSPEELQALRKLLLA